MSRTSMMTSGLLLILVGVQLNLVESFVLTPRATRHWNNRTTGGGGGGGGQLETVPGNYRLTSNGYFQSANAAQQYGNSGGYQNNFQRDYTYSTPSYQQNSTSRVPAYQSSYGASSTAQSTSAVGRLGGPQKMLTPPPWFCWPPIFLGSVLFLFGSAKRD